MRVAMRIVAVLTVICIPAGVALILANAGTGGDMSPLLLPGFGLVALGMVLALTTALLGILASVIVRQWGWLLALLLVAGIPLLGLAVIEVVAGQVDPQTGSVLTNTVANVLLLGAPLLLALVVFVYSFRMRRPRTQLTIGRLA